MFTHIFSAAAAFAATNIDSIIVLTMLFTHRQVTGYPRIRDILSGHYLGFVLLLGVSLLGAYGVSFLPGQWIGLLGAVPLYLGITLLFRNQEEEVIFLPDYHGSTYFRRIAFLTFANGGDNISIYVPLFHPLNGPALTVSLLTFLVLLGLWGWFGFYLAKQPRITKIIEKSGHWLIPLVFILLGLHIIIDSGIIAYLLGKI